MTTFLSSGTNKARMRPGRSTIRNGSRLLLALVLLAVQLSFVWIHSSLPRVYGFGKITVQRSGEFGASDAVWMPPTLGGRTSSSSRNSRTKRSTSELFFAQFSKSTATTTTFADLDDAGGVHNPFSGLFGSRSTMASWFYSSSPLTVLMGKKGGAKADKQNRKPKKQAPAPAPAPAKKKTPEPQRVSSNSNVSVRKQILFGKIKKARREAENAGGSFRQSRKGNLVSTKVQRTSYRKQLNETTIQQKALERQRKGQNPDWSVVLNQTKADPLVLVDGYNIIYKWNRLKQHMTAGDPEQARRLLLDDLEGLASLRRWRIECVFDGAGRGMITPPLGHGPRGTPRYQILSQDASVAPFGKTGSVRTVFTGHQTEADTYIEKRCYAAKNVTMGLTTDMLMVATDDGQIRIVANAAGALCMSSGLFVSQLKAVKKSMQYRVEKAVAQHNNVPMRSEKHWGTDVYLTPAGNANADPDWRSKPKREVLEEHTNGSKSVLVRTSGGTMVIKDNRNKKPRPNKKTTMTNADGTPVKKKKKKKKKKK